MLMLKAFYPNFQQKEQTSVCEGRQTVKLFNVEGSVYLVLLDKTASDHKGQNFKT